MFKYREYDKKTSSLSACCCYFFCLIFFSFSFFCSLVLICVDWKGTQRYRKRMQYVFCTVDRRAECLSVCVRMCVNKNVLANERQLTQQLMLATSQLREAAWCRRRASCDLNCARERAKEKEEKSIVRSLFSSSSNEWFFPIGWLAFYLTTEHTYQCDG